MSDSDGAGETYTDTTSVSWLERIKNAIGGILIGFILIAVACVALFWNEGRAVQTARSLAEGGSAVTTIDAAKPDPANDDRLVHVGGPVRTGAPVTDSEFGVSSNGVRLLRVVEMYQWKEEKRTETRKHVGGSEETITHYSYRRDWGTSREDSSRFHNPDGHQNPALRYRALDLVSTDAMVGGFRAGEAVLRKLPARDELRVDPALEPQLRARGNGPVQVADGRIFLGENPANPGIGDHRVSYRCARPDQISVVARQSGDGFAEYQTKAGDLLLLASPGMVPARGMFRAAERENTIITWLIRLFGTLAMFIGFGLILRPLAVVADFIPLLGSVMGAGTGLVASLLTLLLAPLVVAVAWFFYRPVVAIVILLVGAAAALAVKTFASRRMAAGLRSAPLPAE